MDSAENKLLSVDITNYSGSLEVLLNLAKSQKVDLLKISVTQLADQFIEYINLLFFLNAYFNTFKVPTILLSRQASLYLKLGTTLENSPK